MNLGELRTAARLRLDDSVTPYLWSDAELNSYINQAVNEACLRAQLNIDSTTSETSIIKVVAGTRSSPVHQAVFEIHRAYMQTAQQALERTGFPDLDLHDRAWETRSGKPTKYMLDLNYYTDAGDYRHRLTLYPTPDAADTLQLTVYRVPLADMAADGDEPDLPVVYHPDLLHWVCYLAYLKNDTDTSNGKAAAEYEARFSQSFGVRSSISTQEKMRKARPLRVVGQYL